jgi:hypothetical protein
MVFRQAPSEIPTQTLKPVHILGVTTANSQISGHNDAVIRIFATFAQNITQAVLIGYRDR